jgi:hypothetical protein
MLQATLRFLTTEEDATGDGWEVSLGDEADAPTVTLHPTITAAQGAILAAFQADPSVDGYFTQAAEGSTIAAEPAASAVTAAKAALLSAEGL